ncbi:aminodeoxychorismate synthase component I [Agromyces cerinus]|uniref:aminodeoxychorismate synthase n=1 Tax=Agromyces cerinus subsp. cerinus TaxID=232089 RepID=A0A1N6E4W4_9MICO|nr:aminodeoxychorismate synthase component I [Agromyces cerinus]SIN78095.1 anthranilate synthase component 1 [Agromyces cerinus subsp. cerinus]
MPRRIRQLTLPVWRDPEAVFRACFAESEHVVWLDGGADATSGSSVIAAAHPGTEFVTADVRRGTVSRSRPAASDASARLSTTTAGSIFDVLGEVLAEYRPAPGDDATEATEATEAGGPIGWFGWFSYELGAQLNEVPAAEAATADAAFLFVDRAIVFDHSARSMRLVWLHDDAVESSPADAWVEQLARAIDGLDAASVPLASAVPPSTSAGADRAPTRWRHDPQRYEQLIAECQAAIIRGDAYQLCLTNRVDVDVHPDPATAYLALRASSPSHHGGYLRFGDTALLSASPEQFLHVEPGGIVSTKPMKGTRPRSDDPEADAALRRELLASEKERAENLMIVDLMRNDLGRIAELGTVEVPSLLDVEEYAHVHQLVSTVTARLRHPLTALDAVQSAFPAGSMTGAPKHSAMTILHGLEQGPRGIYSGAFGYLGVDGGADLAMVIRSIVLTPDGASIGTGGGITALSVAAEEVEETRIKARALLAVLGAEMPASE